MVHDDVEVGKMARDRQQMRIGLRIERPPRTALVEVHDDEVVLECSVEITQEGTLRPPRSAVEPKKDGSTPVGAACQQEELRTIDVESLRRTDRSPFREYAIWGMRSQHE